MSVFPVDTITLKCIGVEVDLCAVEPSGCDLHISGHGHTCSVVCACAVPKYSRRIYIEDFNQLPFVSNICDQMLADYVLRIWVQSCICLKYHIYEIIALLCLQFGHLLILLRLLWYICVTHQLPSVNSIFLFTCHWWVALLGGFSAHKCLHYLQYKMQHSAPY